ncbi:MAG: hypothetical protein RI947_1385 [Candidatus Parcubacteria bacterium]|jgi:hypothetical protein
MLAPTLKRFALFIPLLALLALFALPMAAIAAPPVCTPNSTAVPGQCGRAVVTGHYTSLYAEDGNGDYYWDLGDGRVYTSVADLDEATLTVYYYENTYRGSFGGDPFLDNGWVLNSIRGVAADGSVTHYQYLIVHESDPRYTGNPEWAVWGNWEYHVLVDGHAGNIVRRHLAGPTALAGS